MKVIITKYHPPTTYLPARMSATVADPSGIVKRIWTSYFPQDAMRDQSHAFIAKQMRKAMGWEERMVSGTLPDGKRVWVFKRGECI